MGGYGWLPGRDLARVLYYPLNEELRNLFEADQSDRVSAQLSPDLLERDRARRRRVVELLDAGAVETADDFFHAAMTFQHGEGLDDYE